MNAATCDIIIPIWNQPELTQRCLESILEATETPFRLILVDNGSDLPTRELLDQFRSKPGVPVEVIRNVENLGFVKAVNQGIRASKAPWVCLLNNDTVVTRGWLKELVAVASSDSKIGLVNPTSNSLGFSTGEETPQQYAQKLRAESGRTTELSTALGFCLLSRRSLYEDVGLLDETYGMGNFDDDDLSNRVKAAGFQCVRACGAYVHHEEKASFRHLPGWEAAFDQNRERFESRWGRKLRVLMSVPTNLKSSAFPSGEVLRLLHEGHWITFTNGKEELPEQIRSYSQASFLKGAGANHWRLKAASRLLLRRKKPFDLVISFDDRWSRWLKLLGPLYPAQLVQSPSGENLVSTCHQVARPKVASS